MSAKDPYRHYYEQHNRDVDQALARKKKPTPAPEDPGDSNNPWSKAGHNLTRQFELIAKDPARARQLCEEAGCVWTEPQDYYERRSN